MTAEDAKLAAAAAKTDPTVAPYLARAQDLMGIALGVGLSRDESAALIAARLAELDRPRRLAARLFAYLDIVEESDSGREFHPVSFGCCRAAWHEDLNRIMAELKAETTVGGNEDAAQPVRTATLTQA